MKKFCIYGNCQINILRHCLKQNEKFDSDYNNFFIKPVFQLSEKDIVDLEKTISEVDLFIYQPVSKKYKGTEKFSTEYLKKLLKPNSKAISFPVAYFSGYHPEMFYLKGENGRVLEQPFPYHDRNILDFYKQGIEIDNVLESLKNVDFYSQEYLKQNIDKTLSNLSEREIDIDIKISQFIKNNYKKIKLFHTINHPHISIIQFIAEKILSILNFSEPKIDISEISDFCRGSNTNYPIYPSVISGLDCQFSSKFEYRIKTKYLASEQVIKDFFKFYNLHPNLVEKAENRITEVQKR